MIYKVGDKFRVTDRTDTDHTEFVGKVYEVILIRGDEVVFIHEGKKFSFNQGNHEGVVPVINKIKWL